jgi:hypothetical protein
LALLLEGYVKNSLQVAGGVVGAVAGFIATLLVLELVGFGNRADPIMSGLLALLVIAPLGAIAGLVLGTTLATRLRGGENTGGLLRNSPHRQLELKINGQPDRIYHIGLSAKAPHASGLGPWQPNTDGSEIRYRAKWPGRD